MKHFRLPGATLLVMTSTLVLAGEESGQVSWMLSDQIMTVRDVVDANGTLLNHLTYDSFGQIVSQTNSTFHPRFTYTGREFSATSNLYYYRARYYDAPLGRFISEDPSSFEGGDTNLYRYAGNDAAQPGHLLVQGQT